MLGGTDFVYIPSSPEDGMKIRVPVIENKAEILKGMYY